MGVVAPIGQSVDEAFTNAAEALSGIRLVAADIHAEPHALVAGQVTFHTAVRRRDTMPLSMEMTGRRNACGSRLSLPRNPMSESPLLAIPLAAPR
jgi:hypothetical protein